MYARDVYIDICVHIHEYIPSLRAAACIASVLANCAGNSWYASAITCGEEDDGMGAARVTVAEPRAMTMSGASASAGFTAVAVIYRGSGNTLKFSHPKGLAAVAAVCRVREYSFSVAAYLELE